MLEIYNESIRDLLSTSRTIAIESVRADSSTSGRQYTITHDVNGNTHVSDLTIVDVCSIGQISSLLQQAAQSRFVYKFWELFSSKSMAFENIVTLSFLYSYIVNLLFVGLLGRRI